jgi:hypothetical protein
MLLKPNPMVILKYQTVLEGMSSNPGRDKMFLFSTVSRPDLEPTQPPV